MVSCGPSALVRPSPDLVREPSMSHVRRHHRSIGTRAFARVATRLGQDVYRFAIHFLAFLDDRFASLRGPSAIVKAAQGLLRRCRSSQS